MSSSTCDHVSEHRLCYVHCSCCNTILAVSVPCSSLFKIVTVRCGHCTQLLSVNTESSLYPSAAFQPEQQRISLEHRKDLASSSVRSEKATNSIYTAEDESKILSRETPQKRSQRAPSAYNRFMKEEIQRIKASNPGIRHREAFSAAAKNWAHFPTINFGLMVQNSNIMPPPNMNKDDGEVLIAEVL